MPREYAQIFTSVWEDDRDFLALTGEQQRVFFMLATQSDINSVGILVMRLPYWSRLCSDGDPDELEKTLATLAQARFLVIDWDRQLLLVRSFLRWDKGYRNSKRLQMIRKEAAVVRSTPIREALVVEFERCGLEPLPTRPTPKDDQLEIDIPDSPESLFSQVEGTYQNQEGTCQDQQAARVYVSTAVRSNQDPETRSQKPAPAQAPSRLAAAPLAEVTAQDVVGEWVDAVKANGVTPSRSQCGQVGKIAKELLEGNEPERVLAAAKRAGEKGYPSIDRELTVMVAPALKTRPSAVSTTDERVEAIEAMRRQYAASRRAALDARPLPEIGRTDPCP